MKNNLKLYLHGNMTHFNKSCLGYMLEKHNVQI